MKLNIRYLGAVGAILFGGILTMLIQPKPSEAQSPTPVTVTNALSSPVPTLDLSALNYFSAGSGCTLGGVSSCTISNLYTVPSGHTAVVEFFTAQCTIDSGNPLASQTLFSGNGVGAYLPVSQYMGANQTLATTSERIRAYFPASSQLGVTFSASSTEHGFADNCFVTVFGYLTQ